MKLIIFCAFIVSILLLTGCSETGRQLRGIDSGETIVPLFFIETSSIASARTRSLSLDRSGAEINVVGSPVLDFTHIQQIHLVQVDLGLCLLFQLNEQGARDLFRLTVENPGKRIVLTLNGVPVGMRFLEGQIRDGLLFMFLELPDSTLEDLVEQMQDSVESLQRRVR